MNEFGEAQPFLGFLVSLMLGLLVGLQRQWAVTPLAGIRTFALISLLGTACAFLADRHGGIMVGLGFLATISVIVVGNIAKKEQIEDEKGLVTEFSMTLMYIVGVLVHTGPLWLAAAVTGTVAVLLQAKVHLHRLVKRFDQKEIRAFMQFVLISLVLFPIIPDKTYDPYGVLNPSEVWRMVILIVAISLMGYTIYKFFGERAGLWMSGILGGIISSTAATVSYSRLAAQDPERASRGALVILLAWSILYIRVAVEVMLVAPKFREVLAPIGILFVVSVLSTFWLWKTAKENGGMPQQRNPTELGTALTFASLYALIVLAVAYAKVNLGPSALHLVAVVSGVTDVDAIALSTSQLVKSGKLSAKEAWEIVIIAVLSNTFSKGIFTWAIGGTRLFKFVLPTWGATLAAGGILLLMWPS